MSRPGKWIAASLLLALAGPILVRMGIACVMGSGTQMHPAALLLYPAVPFVWAGQGLGIEDSETLFTLSGALGYGSLPLLAWGACNAWSAYRKGIQSWRQELL